MSEHRRAIGWMGEAPPMRVYIREKPGHAAARWMLAQLGAAKPESQSATCPDCESTVVEPRGQRDPELRIAFTPWNAIQWVRGGRLYQCGFCSVQFYDTRE
ncbi:MAG TPA: hypothetical protein VKU01_10755 [Bryobacteraceae bacterium]|nr:hypothetical protein [Bryobacteraceae bacterium]